MTEEKDLAFLQIIECYDEKEKKKEESLKRSITILLLILLPIYFYLRLFNTQFELSGENELCVKNSTAWFINIPAEYNGQQIEEINCEELSTKAPYVRYIYIEDGIKDINSIDSETLMGLHLPDTIEYVGTYAFYGNSNLRWISFPEKAKDKLTISDYAFYGTDIRNIVLPEGTCYIGAFAFGLCTDVETAILPDSVTYIDAGAFGGCINLTSIKLPDNIQYIYPYCFSQCQSLQNVTWPSNLKALSPQALEKSALWEMEPSDIKLPDSVYFVMTSKGYLLDTNKENKYLAEATGIPLEVIEQSHDTSDVWINNQWYTIPMSYSDFMKQDSWSVVEENDTWISVENGSTGEQFKLDTDNLTITGIYSSYANNCVMPGGLISGSSKSHRARLKDSKHSINGDYFTYNWGENNQYTISGEIFPNETISEMHYYLNTH